MCNILTFVDWWVKWKIGSWSLEIWLKNTLDRDLPMMKLLLLFNEFFLYLNAFHGNLNFLEQTYTFLHLLTQLSSLSYVCFIRHGIFSFAAAFLFCCCFFVFPWLFYFAVAVFYLFIFLPWLFYFCRNFVLPLLFYFAVALLFCCDFFILPFLFSFAVAFLLCHAFFILPWVFCFAVALSFLSWLFCFAVTFFFCRGFFTLPRLFSFAEVFLFCRGCFILLWIFHFAVAVLFLLCHGFLFCRGFLVLPWHLWATVAFRLFSRKIFAPNSPIFWIRLVKKQEEHRKLESVMRFTQNQYLVGK